MGIEAPTVYVTEPLIWEYKCAISRLAEEGPLSEDALNALGKEGWELVEIVVDSRTAYCYFKRPKA
jgi:hypothetical protein